MEPWEDALDLDDSDIPNLLRPCKRQHYESQTQTQTQPDPSKLALSSSFRQQLSNPISSQLSPTPSHFPADSQPHFQSQSQLPPLVPEPAAGLSSVSLIPGPAGAFQAARRRSNRASGENLRDKEVQVSAQEYMRSVEENPSEDFIDNNLLWISALEFLSRKGVTRTKSLSDIKKHRNGDKIDMVVAIIKSCTSNGLGDMMVELEDPTDKIAANIHRKVLAQGGYSRDMLVGSILILQKVSVFCSSHRSYYLNISLSNVVEILSEEPASQNSLEPRANSGAAAKSRSSSIFEMPELQASSGETEDQKNCNLSQSSHVTEPMAMDCGAAAGLATSNKTTERYASLRDQNLIRETAGDKYISNKPTEEDLVDLNFKFRSGKNQQSNEKLALGCTQTDITPSRIVPMAIPDQDVEFYMASEQGLVSEKNCTQKQGNTAEDDRFVARENIVQIETQPKNRTVVDNDGPVTSQLNGFKNHVQTQLPPKGLIQEWTDEQLDILDMDDEF